MKLFIYDHCPYCVKALMIFGLKNIPIEVNILLNDDEVTPIKMIGKKMLPILQKDDQNFLPESLDIINFVDNNYGSKIISESSNNRIFNEWLDSIKPILYPLVMPRWVQSSLLEFETQEAKQYFITKKESCIGSFKQHLNNSDKYIAQAKQSLAILEKILSQSNKYLENSLTLNDFHLFAILRSLSIVKDIKFTPKIDKYCNNISLISKITLHNKIAI